LIGIANSTSYAQLQQNGSDLYINTNLGGAVGGNTIFRRGAASTESMRIDSAGNVGIGASDITSVGAYKVLELNGSGGSGGYLRLGSSDAEQGYIASNASGLFYDASAGGSHSFYVSGSERMRILSSGGLTFNGDTSTANALDDYEEGTFTPSLTFGGSSTGMTFFDRAGVYTKIGRQVTCTIYVALTAKGSSTGQASITSLPFANGNENRGSLAIASLRFDNITYSGSVQLLLPNGSTSLNFEQVTEAGTDSQITHSNFNDSTEMSATITYFV
jgi:hypothetical protein